ncbi:HAD family hydrolase [Deinococcus multiflagellatus]|uniref:HAD family hydrolase n=1 Tax=Deinococcus multiflagellatus TaxID=1656887 RepID=UPI001CD016A6|nr:HAD family hydrolase [Deinococcus multiflagellatus]MBZ9715532.1 HAD family hydrolase [Deinococcus multiflagellatus]
MNALAPHDVRKLLIWDFDGTLAYRQGLWSGALLQILDREAPGHTVQLEQLRPALQRGFRWHAPDQAHPLGSADEWWAELQPLFKRAYVEAGLSEPLAQRCARQMRQQYTDSAHWSVYADTVPVLQQLSTEGWTHAVLTNHVPEFRRLLEGLELAAFFDVAVNSAETGFEKPHPEAFRVVLRAFPEAVAVCMIGDSLTADVAGAQGVGLPVIQVRGAVEAGQGGCPDLHWVPERLRIMFPPVN